MKLQVYDSDGSIGGGAKLADTLSKAFFGDGEAAAKIALAKAQIEAQRKHADYYGAQTGKTQQETRTAEEQAAANRNLAARAEAEAREKVQRPVPVPSGETKIDVQGDTAGRQVSAPVPVVVQPTPAQIRLYEAQREAEAARARAVAIAGGNAQQVAQGINLQTGGLLLRHHANPTEARVGATLTTGNLPTTSTVVVPGDTAGTDAARDAAIAQDKVKPHWSSDPNTQLPLVTRPDGKGGFTTESTQTAVPGKKVDPTTTQETVAAVATMREKMRAFKAGTGPPPTAQEADDYAVAIHRAYEPKPYKYVDDKGATKEGVDYFLPPGTWHPNEVRGVAGVPPTAAPPAGGSTTQPPAVTPPPAGAVATDTSSRVGTDYTTKPPTPIVPTTDKGVTSRGFTERVGEALSFFGDDMTRGPFTAKNVPNDLISVITSLPSGSATRDVFLSQIPDGPTKRYMTAALNIIYPILRLESGALISKEEILNMLATHVPMPNEEQASVEQKLGAMAAAVRSIAVMGFGSMDTPDYKKFHAMMAARGFDLNRTFTGKGVDTVFNRGKPVDVRPSVAGIPVAPPAVAAQPGTPGAVAPAPGGPGPKIGDLVLKNGKLVPYAGP